MLLKYVNALIYNENSELSRVQLVIHEMGTFKCETQLKTLEEIKEVYHNDITDKNITLDFRVVDNKLQCNTFLPRYNMSNADILQLDKTTNKVVEPFKNNLFDLYLDLMEDKSYLSDDKNGETVTKFKPKISSSTMTVYISYIKDNSWFSKKLINVVDGILETQSFIVIVPSTKRNYYVDNYKLEYIKDINFCEKNYSMLIYNKNLTPYIYPNVNFILYQPIINKYVFKSEILQGYIDNCESIIRAYSLYDKTETTQVERQSSSTSKYSYNYVRFIPNYKRPNKSERAEYLKIFKENYNDRASLQLPKLDTVKTILRGNLLDILYKIHPMEKASKLDYLQFNIERCSDMKVKTDLFLYSLRTHLFIDDIIPNQEVMLFGSEAPESYIKKVKCD